MKINSITHEMYHYKGSGTRHRESIMRESAPKQDNTKLNNENINTTIKSNSGGRASFKGAAEPLLHRAAMFTSHNPLVAEALFALIITCGLRPISIMATAKSDEDKEKCQYQAAKSISSGLIGLGLTALVGTTVAAASKAAMGKGAFKMPEEMKAKSKQIVDKGVESLTNFGKQLIEEGKDLNLAEQIQNLTHGGKLHLNEFKKAGKNAKKIFTNEIEQKAPQISDAVKQALKEQQVLNNYERTGKNVIDKLFQPIFMPLRANITIALIPLILGIFGLKKPGAKKAENNAQKPESNNSVQNAKSNPYDSLQYKVCENSNEKELFGSFSGVANHENK